MLSESEARELVSEFLTKYFKELVAVVEFEEKFIREQELEITKVDYFKLRRFLTTALRNLKDLDFQLISGLLAKLHHDVNDLFDFYAQWAQQTQVAGVVFEHFLTKLKPYQDIKVEITKTKAFKDNYEIKMKGMEEIIRHLESNLNDPKVRAEYKKAKDNYADVVHNFAQCRDSLADLSKQLEEISLAVKQPFVQIFASQKILLFNRLKIAINTKAYYLDKLLWYRASNSRRIQKFFDEAQIDGDYDMKTFVKYYLKNINIEQSHENEWHAYLGELVKTLD